MNESNESMRVSRGLLLREAVAWPVASVAMQPSTHWSKPRQLRLHVLSCLCVCPTKPTRTTPDADKPGGLGGPHRFACFGFVVFAWGPWVDEWLDGWVQTQRQTNPKTTSGRPSPSSHKSHCPKAEKRQARATVIGPGSGTAGPLDCQGCCQRRNGRKWSPVRSAVRPISGPGEIAQILKHSSAVLQGSVVATRPLLVSARSFHHHRGSQAMFGWQGRAGRSEADEEEEAPTYGCGAGHDEGPCGHPGTGTLAASAPVANCGWPAHEVLHEAIAPTGWRMAKDFSLCVLLNGSQAGLPGRAGRRRGDLEAAWNPTRLQPPQG